MRVIAMSKASRALCILFAKFLEQIGNKAGRTDLICSHLIKTMTLLFKASTESYMTQFLIAKYWARLPNKYSNMMPS